MCRTGMDRSLDQPGETRLFTLGEGFLVHLNGQAHLIRRPDRRGDPFSFRYRARLEKERLRRIQLVAERDDLQHVMKLMARRQQVRQALHPSRLQDIAPEEFGLLEPERSRVFPQRAEDESLAAQPMEEVALQG